MADEVATAAVAGERGSPRVMVALIALAGELPVPGSITFYADAGILALSFDAVADGLAWSGFLGGQAAPYVRNGTRYLGDQGVLLWRGWSVLLHASEASTDTALDAGITGRLVEVVTVVAA